MAVSTRVAKADLSRQLNRKVVGLYRRMARQVPRMIKLYEIPYAVAEMRHLLNILFKKNAHLTDPRVIEMLVVRGEMEMEETLNQWKQRGHLLDILELDAVQAQDETKGKSVLDDQSWIAGIVEAVELQNGREIDGSRLARIVHQARVEELGETPGEQLAPGDSDVTTRYFENRRTEELGFIDRFYNDTTEDGGASGSSRPLDSPLWLRQLRQRIANDEPTREEMRDALLQRAADNEVGEGPWIRPPKAVAGKNLPLWVASKVHYPWVPEELDSADPRNLALLEEFKDAAEAGYDGERDSDMQVGILREHARDPLRHGRAYE